MRNIYDIHPDIYTYRYTYSDTQRCLETHTNTHTYMEQTGAGERRWGRREREERDGRRGAPKQASVTVVGTYACVCIPKRASVTVVGINGCISGIPAGRVRAKGQSGQLGGEDKVGGERRKEGERVYVEGRVRGR